MKPFYFFNQILSTAILIYFTLKSPLHPSFKYKMNVTILQRQTHTLYDLCDIYMYEYIQNYCIRGNTFIDDE